MITIAVDAMGGDYGPEITIAGSALAVRRYPGLMPIFYGLAERVEPVLRKYPELANCPFHATEAETSMDEKPSQALRSGRGKSSMWHAIETVQKNEANACVSAGNTGALMAMSYFCLRMLAEAERPGIAGIWPTLQGESIVLDIGATIGANASQLVDFALMGAGMYRVLYTIEKPTIGLLNIGVEEVKGLEEIRKAGQILKEMSSTVFEYKGFVEGNNIGEGIVDVVVTEGFVGNVALKTAEGTVHQAVKILGSALRQSVWSRIGYLLAKTAFRQFRQKLDPRKVNGGVLLGLNGVVIKSHGGADAEGFCSALRIGYEMVKNNLLERISMDLRHFHDENKPSLLSDSEKNLDNRGIV